MTLAEGINFSHGEANAYINEQILSEESGTDLFGWISKSEPNSASTEVLPTSKEAGQEGEADGA